MLDLGPMRVRRIVLGLAVITLVAAGALFGPARRWQLRRACAHADAAACIAACEAGVAGDDGCLGGADLLDAMDEDVRRAPSEFEAARSPRDELEAPRPVGEVGALLARGCRLGAVEACLRLARAAERELSANPPESHHAEVLRRVKWHDPACTLGDADSCDRVFRAALGSDDELALSAARRACSLAPDAGDAGACVHDRTARVRQVEAERTGCDGGDARACARLGELLRSALTETASVLAFAAECRLRGRDDASAWPSHRPIPKEEPGGCWFPAYVPPEVGYCACERFSRASEGDTGRDRGSPALPAVPSASAAPVSVQVSAVEAKALDPRAVDEAIARIVPELEACGVAAQRSVPKLEASARVRVEVDKLGDVWRRSYELDATPAPSRREPPSDEERDARRALETCARDRIQRWAWVPTATTSGSVASLRFRLAFGRAGRLADPR